jgi:hypothetical protein
LQYQMALELLELVIITALLLLLVQITVPHHNERIWSSFWYYE